MTQKYLQNPTPEQIREVQQSNGLLILITVRGRRATVLIDLGESFLGRNRYEFTPAGRLEVHRIMTSRPWKSDTVWASMRRIAVAEALAELPEKHLKTPLWHWVD